MTAVVGRLRGRSEFRALTRPDGRGAHGPVSVSFVGAGATSAVPAVGFAIGRAHGNAVRRNRLRRRLRAAAAAAGDLAPGSYLVRASPAAASLTFDEMVAALRTATARAARAGGRDLPDAPGGDR